MPRSPAHKRNDLLSPSRRLVPSSLPGSLALIKIGCRCVWSDVAPGAIRVGTSHHFYITFKGHAARCLQNPFCARPESPERTADRTAAALEPRTCPQERGQTNNRLSV